MQFAVKVLGRIYEREKEGMAVAAYAAVLGSIQPMILSLASKLTSMLLVANEEEFLRRFSPNIIPELIAVNVIVVPHIDSHFRNIIYTRDNASNGNAMTQRESQLVAGIANILNACIVEREIASSSQFRISMDAVTQLIKKRWRRTWYAVNARSYGPNQAHVRKCGVGPPRASANGTAGGD